MVRRTGFRIQVSGVRLLVGALVLLLAPDTWQLTSSLAQQPQAQQGQPLSALNAKYVNGVAPGYWPTAATGLTLNLSAGTSVCNNSPVTYAGGTLTMTASATNYVFLDMTNNCTPALTSGGASFPATGVPIAVVTTSGSAITAISDVRSWFVARPVVDPGGQVYNVEIYGADPTGVADSTAAIQAGLNQVCGVPGVSSGTGNLYFPPGTYKITSTLYCVPQSIVYADRISGAVGGTDGGSGSTILWAGPTGGTMMVLMGWREGVMENLNFNMNNTALYGLVVSSTVNTLSATTLGTAVTAPGSVTVTPGSMGNITGPSGQFPGTIINVDTGSNFEVVFVTATTATTFTATFAKTHLATASIGGTGDTGGDLFQSVGVYNIATGGGTYSAGWLVGQKPDADLAGVYWDHCQAVGTGYAGVLLDGGANVLNFSWKRGWFFGLEHAIDAAGYLGFVTVEDADFEGDTVSDINVVNYLSTQIKISSVRTELGSGATFISSAGSTASPGSLEVENSFIASGATAPTNDCLVNWQGGMTIRGTTFFAPTGHIAKICANAATFPNSQNWGGVTLIGNTFQGLTSGFPPVYNGTSLAYGNNAAPIYAMMNWGVSSDANTVARLSDYEPVGSLADESQSIVSTSGVLNGGDRSCLLGWRNHANTADITVCKNTSDALVLGGAAGISATQIASTVATGTPPLSATSTTPVANLTVQNCDTCNITTSMTVGGGTALHAMNLYSSSSITPTAVTASSCSDQTFTVSGLLATDRVSSIAPPSALGNLSLNGYASAAGTVLLHFCNPSSSSVTPPAGVYSFLAVH
jgi:hypothetical protein